MTTGWKNTTLKYGWLSIPLHWIMLLRIVATYIAMDIKSIFPKGGSEREVIATWHYTFGLSVDVRAG